MAAWGWLAAILLPTGACVAGGGNGEQVTSAERKRKASFVGKMLRFVEWPEGPNEPRRARLKFCVAGDGFLSFALSEELHATTIRGRAIEVRWVKEEAELNGCDAVYFAGPGKRTDAKWLQDLKGTVLTLGEGKDFLEEGGMVQITSENEKLQFAVNLDEVRRARLKIDARLLELAKGVSKAGKPAGD